MAELLDLDIDVVDTISKALEIAPQRITSVIRKRFSAERNRFVGNRRKGKAGAFTRRVLALPLRNRPGTMPMKIAGRFRGFVQSPTEDSGEISLRMGILSPSPKPFIQGVVQLQSGYSRTSGKYMPLPVYSNLAKQGVTKNYQKTFAQMMQNDELQPIKLGGKVLFVNKEMLRGGADVDDATMFIGVKRVSVPGYDFKFYQRFLQAYPAMQVRLKNAIDREIAAINRGYAVAE